MEFTKYLEKLNSDFEKYLTTKYLKRTAYKHSVIVGYFIDFAPFDYGITSIEQITKSIYNSKFWTWHQSKIGDYTKDEVKVAMKKFAIFLEQEKNISHLANFVKTKK